MPPAPRRAVRPAELERAVREIALALMQVIPAVGFLNSELANEAHLRGDEALRDRLHELEPELQGALRSLRRALLIVAPDSVQAIDDDLAEPR